MGNDEEQLRTTAGVLETALKREKAAYNFYNNLLKDTNVEFLKDLLEQLREEEYKHIRLIEKKIAKLGLG